MRDLGLMGESTFSLWCADAGLIPNGSQIDKTGWDFLVESPYKPGFSPQEIHKPAFECKVQVKSTDKNDRKLPVTLSNLRRLITAQMPAFFVFLEFDGEINAQKAFVVHVDHGLITKVLKKMHGVEQSEKENNFNKRKMTVNYDESNLLDEPTGKSLKSCFLSHVGGNVAEYIARKKSHLESAGYEDGVAQMTFTTEEGNLKALVDVSLGIQKEVEVLDLKSADTRFGILSDNPSLDLESSTLSMPDVNPVTEGKVRFRDNKLSAGLSFPAGIYISPFQAMVPDEFKKVRIKCEFFDLNFNPATGSVNFSFSFGDGIRLEVRKFRDALKLAYLLSSSGRKIFTELIFDGSSDSSFSVNVEEKAFDFSNELKVLESAVRVLSDFEMTDVVDISFGEISQYSTQIFQMESVFSASPSLFKLEFEGGGNKYDLKRGAACIFFITAPVGSHLFGVILVLTGNLEEIGSDKYKFTTKEIVVEQRIVSEKQEPIRHEDLVAAIQNIEQKYHDAFSVFRMYE